MTKCYFTLLAHVLLVTQLFSPACKSLITVEGTLVKALIHYKLENLKKLIESLLFPEHTMITGQGFHISFGWLIYSWSTLTFV